jgi:hypothetical protein
VFFLLLVREIDIQVSEKAFVMGYCLYGYPQGLELDQLESASDSPDVLDS